MPDFRVGEAVQVAGKPVSVMRILGRNAGPMTGLGTNTYLIGDKHLTVIDPGPADARHVDAILGAIADRKLARILVTHTHADHSPGAQLLKQKTGAELLGLPPPRQEHQDTSFQSDREVGHGDVLNNPEYSIEMVHTPGHVSNHLCYLLLEQAMLFTGDHILEGTTSVILPPDGDMGHYMDSLAHLQTLNLKHLAPGHGDIINDPIQAITKLVRHRQQREQKVVRALARLGVSSLDELTEAVYDDVARHLIPWARQTLLAHLIKLSREQQVDESAAGWKLRARE